MHCLDRIAQTRVSVVVAAILCAFGYTPLFADQVGAFDVSEFSSASLASDIESGERPDAAGVSKPSCSCCGTSPCEGGLDYMFVFQGGATYYSVIGESRFGGSYGLDMVMALTGNWGAMGRFNMNHVAVGEQILGTVGIFKLSDPCSCDWRDRTTVAVSFDQFTDTRVNTVAGSLYLNQLRGQLGYAIRDDLEVGVVYTEPTNRDNNVNIRLVNFPTSLPLPGSVRMTRSGMGYISGNRGDLQWLAFAGYRAEPVGSSFLGTSLRRSITPRLASYAQGSYDVDNAGWSAALGLEFSFGPSAGYSNCCNADGRCAYVEGDDLVRAQSPQRTDRLTNVPIDGDEATPPPESLGEFPREFFGGFPATTGVAPLSARYLQHSVHLLTPYAPIYCNSMIERLNDPNQNLIQGGASPFAIETNGGLGKQNRK